MINGQKRQNVKTKCESRYRVSTHQVITPLLQHTLTNDGTTLDLD